MILIAPESAPQIHTPLGGVEHPLAAEVMDALRKRGSEPVPLCPCGAWSTGLPAPARLD